MLKLFTFSMDTNTGQTAISGNISPKEALQQLLEIVISTEAASLQEKKDSIKKEVESNGSESKA